MVDKKIENIRVKQEIAITNKLKEKTKTVENFIGK
jgi:hypothetical protein